MTPYRLSCDEEDFSGRMILDDRIQLIERLGAGAFGAVYRAQEFALGVPLREVAVKLTHRRALTPVGAREQLREGFILSSVHGHCSDADALRHLIQVYHIGLVDELDGRGCLVMEFVPGVRLMDHIQTFGASIPMTTARRYFRQLCAAVAACHAHDPPITHGDLKPDNILVDQRRMLRVVDFGLARPLERLAGYVANPQCCLSYTAPEVLLGRGLPQSDIYSLGLIMYELLTGDGPHLHLPPPPPSSGQWYYYQQKRDMVFPPIAERTSSIEPDLHLFGIVERCLQFHEKARYDSIGDLLQKLEGEAVSVPEPAPPPDAGPAPSREGVDWVICAERCRTDCDHQRGLSAIEMAPCDDLRRDAYRAIFLAFASRWREAYDVGGDLFIARTLPAELHEALGHALLDAATELGRTDPDYNPVAEFFRNQMRAI